MIRHRVHRAAARDQPRPEEEATLVVLRNGSRVLVRPVRSTDAWLLAEGFARLSELAGPGAGQRAAGPAV